MTRLADPIYLLLLLIAIPMVVLFIWEKIGKEASLHFSNTNLVKSSGVFSLSYRRFFSGLFRLAVLVLLILALVRPQTGEGESEETREVIDIMIVLDISSSMAMLDFHPENRLTAAKIEANRFIQSRTDDRIGLITFAKHGLTVSPLTTDHDALKGLLGKIQMGILEDGTAIGVGLASAVNRLRESEAKGKAVILLTDGVNNSGEIDPITAGEIARELGVRVYTIGMGTDGYSLVPNNDPQKGGRLLRVYNEIDEETLQTIAKDTGGLYFRAKDEVALRRIFEEIDRLEKTEIKVNTFTTYEDHYSIFLKYAFFLLIFEILLTHIIWRKVP